MKHESECRIRLTLTRREQIRDILLEVIKDQGEKILDFSDRQVLVKGPGCVLVDFTRLGAEHWKKKEYRITPTFFKYEWGDELMWESEFDPRTWDYSKGTLVILRGPYGIQNHFVLLR